MADNSNGAKTTTKLLGVEFAPVNLPLERRLQTFSVLFSVSLLIILPFFIYPTVIYLVLFSSYEVFIITAPVLIPYLCWIWVVDRNSCNKGGRTVSWSRNLGLWRWYRDYFPIRLVKTAELDPKKNYLIGNHPHGILCRGAFGAFGTNALQVDQLYKGLSFHILTLELNFKCPLVRDIFLSMGACAASRHGMDHLLSTPGGGKAAVLIPGGAPESLDSHPGTYVVQLNNRKGFIKVALQNGASLVPCFSFGENEIYDQLKNPKGSLLRTLQDKLQSMIQVAPVLPNGRGVFQYSFGVMPQRRPITVVVGGPIDVEKIETPTQRDIDNLHKKYVDALVGLFNEFKDEYAEDPSAAIRIV